MYLTDRTGKNFRTKPSTKRGSAQLRHLSSVPLQGRISAHACHSVTTWSCFRGTHRLQKFCCCLKSKQGLLFPFSESKVSFFGRIQHLPSAGSEPLNRYTPRIAQLIPFHRAWQCISLSLPSLKKKRKEKKRKKETGNATIPLILAVLSALA